MTIKKVHSEEAKKAKGKTNWKEVDRLSEQDIEQAAKDDPDSALPSADELKGFKPVNPRKH